LVWRLGCKRPKPGEGSMKQKKVQEQIMNTRRTINREIDTRLYKQKVEATITV
jgi:hypothetical protein